jgi:hypothetical protein
MPYRNTTLYRAEFTGLRLNAFGLDQVVDWAGTIVVFQKRVSPELWCARPTFSKGRHKWEAGSAEALMELISGDFVGVVRPWREVGIDAAPDKRMKLISDIAFPRRAAG